MFLGGKSLTELGTEPHQEFLTLILKPKITFFNIVIISVFILVIKARI